MNKGLRLIFCKECKRKRFHSRRSIPNYNFEWTCSKGHKWIEIGITLNKINAMMQDVFSPDKLRNLFEREDIFYRTLKK